MTITPTPTKPPLGEREPAVLIGTALGALITVLTTIQQATAGELTWWAASPIIIGALGGTLVRFGVISPATYNAALTEAKDVTSVATNIINGIPSAEETAAAVRSSLPSRGGPTATT